MSFDPSRKVMTGEAAAAWRAGVRGRVVFTNGVFDLLHRGHVDSLTMARSLGDALIVAVNSDASVRRLKGPSRPIREHADRCYVVAALACVDVVVGFDDDTPLSIIRELRPDVLVKGGDYTIETVVGASDVINWGGEVHILPLTKGHSTTSTIAKL